MRGKRLGFGTTTRWIRGCLFCGIIDAWWWRSLLAVATAQTNDGSDAVASFPHQSSSSSPIIPPPTPAIRFPFPFPFPNQWILRKVLWEGAQSVVNDHRNTVVTALIVAEILAYLGVLGKRGEFLGDYLLQEAQAHTGWGAAARRLSEELDMRPGGRLRSRVDHAILRFRDDTSPRTKFVVAVGLSTHCFDGLVRSVAWTLVILGTVTVVAEGLALVGLLGEPGEGLLDYWEDEGSSDTWRRRLGWFQQERTRLRRLFRLNELYKNGWSALTGDHGVFWVGLMVGSIASTIFHK